MSVSPICLHVRPIASTLDLSIHYIIPMHQCMPPPPQRVSAKRTRICPARSKFDHFRSKMTKITLCRDSCRPWNFPVSIVHDGLLLPRQTDPPAGHPVPGSEIKQC